MSPVIAIPIIAAFIGLCIWLGSGDDGSSNGPGLNQHNGGAGF